MEKFCIFFPPFCCFSLFFDPLCFFNGQKRIQLLKLHRKRVLLFNKFHKIGKTSPKTVKNDPKLYTVFKIISLPPPLHPIIWRPKVSPSEKKRINVRPQAKPIEVFGSDSVPTVHSETIQSCINFQSWKIQSQKIQSMTIQVRYLSLVKLARNQRTSLYINLEFIGHLNKVSD